MSDRFLPDFEAKHKKLYDKNTILLNHRLADSGLFTEEAIGKLIERCNKEDYIVATMGYNKEVKEWRNGEIGDLSGLEVIEAIRKGRMWMNIHRIMDRDPQYQVVLDKIFGELIDYMPAFKTFKRNMTLLISSPKIQVYYHADIQGQSLWQISGKKRVYVYPATDAFISDDSIEKVLLRETEEEVPYETWFDDYAEVYDLEPGQMVHWPLYAPHRVENQDCLNISVTTEHWTREIWNSYVVNYGNGVIRRTLGLQNFSQRPEGFHVYPKAAACLLWKKIKIAKAREFKHTIDFRVDPRADQGLVDIDPYEIAA
ncbi:MAG: hypothetical protein ABJL18_07370 [Hyphomicrobiales bacterium]